MVLDPFAVNDGDSGHTFLHERQRPHSLEPALPLGSSKLHQDAGRGRTARFAPACLHRGVAS
jgi:hypothetical protein